MTTPSANQPAFGLGFRLAHTHQIEAGEATRTDFFEIISENFMQAGGRPRRNLEMLRERYPVYTHGVSLSIAASDPLRADYLEHLRKLVQWLKPQIVSDHLCWTTNAHRNTHDLLPVAYTEEALAHVAARVREVQDRLDHRIYIENPSAYVNFAGNEMDEATFLAELVGRTGCGLLLDVNNIFVNTMNLGIDPISYLAKIPAEAVGYFHLAGHSVEPDVRIDTHDAPVCDEVWSLYAVAARRFPKTPTLVEWDDKIPTLAGLEDELDKARAVHARVQTDVPLPALEQTAIELVSRAARAAISNPDTIETKASWLTTQETMIAMVEQVDNVDSKDQRVAMFEDGLPVQRLRGINVYNNAYFFRLRDVLADATPGLLGVIGSETFTRMAVWYFAAHPPTSYNIKFLGAHLADFLRSYDAALHAEIDNRALADLVALEVARFDVFDELDGAAPIGVETLAAIAPDDWAETRFTFNPALRAVTTHYDIWDLWEACQDEANTVPKPELMPSAYLVYRRDDCVLHEKMSPASARLLNALSSGATFAEACAAFDGTGAPAESEETMQQVVGQLVHWFGLGLIAAVG